MQVFMTAYPFWFSTGNKLKIKTYVSGPWNVGLGFRPVKNDHANTGSFVFFLLL